MVLNHCTELAALREILRFRFLKLGDIPEYPPLAKLGLRGVWLSTAAYGDQFFGPFRLTFDAADLLPKRFLLLRSSTTASVLFASHSPTLDALAAASAFELIDATSTSSPLCLGSSGWEAIGKVDVICDFPIPVAKATTANAGTSLWTRAGAVKNALDRMNPRTGAQLMALLLHEDASDLDQALQSNVEDLAAQLFRALHGNGFDNRVKRTRGTFSPAELEELDLISLSTERLLDGDLDGAMDIASLAESDIILADKIAEKVNNRFKFSFVRSDFLLQY